MTNRAVIPSVTSANMTSKMTASLGHQLQSQVPGTWAKNQVGFVSEIIIENTIVGFVKCNDNILP